MQQLKEISDNGEWYENLIDEIEFEKFLNSLPPKQREVAFLLIEGWNEKEIAEQLDRCYRAVKKDVCKLRAWMNLKILEC